MSSTHQVTVIAAAAFARGDYAAAEQAYGALLLSKPLPEPGVLSGWAVNRANCLLRLERTEDAERACRLALRLEAGNADAHEMLGAATFLRQEGRPAEVAERFYQFVALGRFQEAASACVAVMCQNGMLPPPESGKWQLNRAICVLKAETVGGEIDAGERAVRALFDQEMFLEADKALCKLLQGCGIGSPASQRAKWLRSRASCQLRVLRPSDAEQLARLALRMDPPSAGDSHEILAAAIHLMVKDGQRWRVHEEVSEREHAWKAARGTPAEEKRRQALDKACAQKAQIVNQRDLDAKRGKMLLDQQKFEEAAVFLSRAVDATPPGLDRGRVQDLLGITLCRQQTGNYKEDNENYEMAIRHFEAALQVYTHEATPHDWARTQTILAAVYSDRLTGERKQNIETAIRHYEAALQVYTREAAPHEWAMTQMNLADAFFSQLVGERKWNIETAIRLYEETLQVWTREAAPHDWAMMQTKIANAYKDRLAGERRENLETAIQCFEAALQVLTRKTYPHDWAKTQVNLAIAHSDRLVGERKRNIETAIRLYEAALQVLTREAAPHDWALAQMFQAIAFSRVEGNSNENIEKAIHNLEAALQVWTREVAPHDWAKAQHNLGEMYRIRLAGERKQNIERAIWQFELALQVRTSEVDPHKWALTTMSLASAYRTRLAGQRKENIETAILLFEAALKVFTREAAPHDWALTQNNLGNAYNDRLTGEHGENIEKAIGHFQAAVQVRTREVAPYDWAMTQINLGNAFISRLAGERKENIERAILHYEAVLQIFNRVAAPHEWAKTQMNLAAAYFYRLVGKHKENIEASIQHYEAALQILTFEADPQQHSAALSAMAQCLFYTSKIPAAITAAKSALDALDGLREVTFAAGDDFSAKQHLSTSSTQSTIILTQCLLHPSINDPTSALELLDASHSRSLADLAYSPANKDEASIPAGAPCRSERIAWSKARLSLSHLQRELDVAEKQTPSQSFSDASLRARRTEVQTALREERQLRDTIVSADPSFLSAQSVKPLCFAELQGAVGPDAVAAAWFWFGSDKNGAWDEPDTCIAGVFLFCTSLAQPKVMLYDKAQRAEILKACNFFYFAQQSKDDSIFSAALQRLSHALQMRRFYEEFLRKNDTSAGLNYHAANFPHLVILPYGLFQPIPFDSLPVTADGVCLSDVYADGTFYAPSLSLLRAARRPGTNMRLDAGSFLAVQNPTRDLTGADEEVQMLVRMLGPGVPRVLQHGAATKAALTTELNARRNHPSLVLHFSCHGRFDSKQPWLGGLVMANHETLTVSNVMDLQLRNCHLCALSACDTGRLDTRGMEAVGLTSAFLVAGVQRVVSSLWPVSDTATALLMARMYEQLIRSDGQVSVTAALRNAQIWLRTLRFDEAQKELGLIDRSLADRLLVEVRQRQRLRGETEAGDAASEVPRRQMLWINTRVPCTAGLANRVGLSGFFHPADDAVSRNPGEKFTEQSWVDFVTAFEDNRVTFAPVSDHQRQ